MYEYSIDNYWFRTVDLENQPVNPPLRGNRTADVVIIGGGFTGLSAAYNISRKFPDKKIVVVEGARCGYGASGRNGGFCITTDWIDGLEDLEGEERQKALRVASHGLEPDQASDHGARSRL